MKKVKQILALIGVFFLIGLYLLTLISAILDNPHSMNYFAASVLATVMVPVLLWAYSFIYRLLSGKGTPDVEKTSDKKPSASPINKTSDEDSATASTDAPKENDDKS